MYHCAWTPRTGVALPGPGGICNISLQIFSRKSWFWIDFWFIFWSILTSFFFKKNTKKTWKKSEKIEKKCEKNRKIQNRISLNFNCKNAFWDDFLRKKMRKKIWKMLKKNLKKYDFFFEKWSDFWPIFGGQKFAFFIEFSIEMEEKCHNNGLYRVLWSYYGVVTCSGTWGHLHVHFFYCTSTYTFFAEGPGDEGEPESLDSGLDGVARRGGVRGGEGIETARNPAPKLVRGRAYVPQFSAQNDRFYYEKLSNLVWGPSENDQIPSNSQGVLCYNFP